MSERSALVTGAAGFIGSHLVDALLDRDYRILGLDLLTDFYSPSEKLANLNDARRNPRFTFLQADVATAPLTDLLKDVDVVFHVAAQPGVRTSWGPTFDDYVQHNVVATQRLLEACKATPKLRVVNSSTSSVYGNVHEGPTTEDDALRPHSPYGVTKLAAELLARAYADNWGIDVVSLRYFTVYGPRQRPDMAFSKLLRAAKTGEPFTIFGRSKVRDFTFVGDAVNANLLAAKANVQPGSAYNIGGGSAVDLHHAIQLVEEILGRSIPTVLGSDPVGDVGRTGADITSARRDLGWQPNTSLADGLRAQVEWWQLQRD